MGLHAPSGVCGQVYIYGEQLPPPDNKWEKVDLPTGSVKIRMAALTGRKIRGKKWLDLEKADLEKLAFLERPCRPLARAVGPVLSGTRVMVSANTNYNAFKSVCCRAFSKVPEPRTGIWEFAAAFKRALLPEWDSPPSEMTDEEWIESMPARRRAPLRLALQLYRRTGWCKKYATFRSFIKVEFLMYFSKDEYGILPLRAIVDRLINGPHDVTHVIAGKKIKPYLGWLKRQWHCESHLFYGGVEPAKLQRWLSRATSQGPKLVFWSDYSSFDSCHNEQTWAFVESLYEQYRGDKDFQSVLEAWRAPVGQILDLKFRFRVMNASGRDDTALANAILNGFAMLLSVAAAWYEKDLRELDTSDLVSISSILLLSVCGDDALGFLPSVDEATALRFRDRLVANLKDFGFVAKAYCSDRFEDAVYLGHRPLPVDGVWYWSRTLGRCLPKLGWQCGLTGNGNAYMNGVMEMHTVCSAHVPVLSDIANSWLESTVGRPRTPWQEDPNKPWECMGVFGPKHYARDTIEALARAYTVDRRPCRTDLSPQDVAVSLVDVMHCIEYVKAQVKGQVCVLDHWLLTHMVWVDEQ